MGSYHPSQDLTCRLCAYAPTILRSIVLEIVAPIDGMLPPGETVRVPLNPKPGCGLINLDLCANRPEEKKALTFWCE